MLLKLDLQDGFEGDIVTIKINSKELYHKEGVKTELTLGYADSIEAEVAEGPCRVEVTLPEKGISKSIHLEIMAPVYIGLSVLNGKIVHRLSNTFFAYL
jgi:hypothetical protein